MSKKISSEHSQYESLFTRREVLVRIGAVMAGLTGITTTAIFFQRYLENKELHSLPIKPLVAFLQRLKEIEPFREPLALGFKRGNSYAFIERVASGFEESLNSDFPVDSSEYTVDIAFMPRPQKRPPDEERFLGPVPITLDEALLVYNRALHESAFGLHSIALSPRNVEAFISKSEEWQKEVQAVYDSALKGLAKLLERRANLGVVQGSMERAILAQFRAGENPVSRLALYFIVTFGPQIHIESNIGLLFEDPLAASTGRVEISHLGGSVNLDNEYFVDEEWLHFLQTEQRKVSEKLEESVYPALMMKMRSAGGPGIEFIEWV